jgi:hypothetical protein
MFNLELSPHQVLWLGKILIDTASADGDASGEATDLYHALTYLITKGEK